MNMFPVSIYYAEDEAGFPVLILDKLGDANNDTQDNGIVPSKMEDRGDSKNPVAVAGDQIEASNMAGNPNMAAQSAANEVCVCYHALSLQLLS